MKKSLMTPAAPTPPIPKTARFRPLAALVSLALLAACGDGNSSTILIDTTALQQQAALNGAEVDRIDLLITAADFETPQVLTIKEDIDLIEVEVVAGAARTFDLLAVSIGYGVVDPPYWSTAEGEFPLFWGVITVDLQARADILLELPVFPSGRVEGSASGESVTFVAADPYPDQAASHTFPVSDGEFSAVLPSGSYTSEAGDLSFEVAQGQVLTGL